MFEHLNKRSVDRERVYDFKFNINTLISMVVEIGITATPFLLACSEGVLREDTDDAVFLVLLLEVLLVLGAEEVERKEGEDQEERVAPL